MNSLNTRRRRWMFCAMLVSALQCDVNASGQVTSGDQLPEALKDIKPVAACRRDDVLPGTIGNPGPAEFAPDLGCAITVGEMQALLSRSNTAIVDLRPAAAYQSFHIEGAINLSLSDLHSKPYWRSKMVLLIGSGKGEGELYSACASLTHSGYKQVRVLRGGMPQWLDHNQTVAGRAPSAQQLARLSAGEFWLEGQNLDNLVVLAKEQRALKADIPFSVILPQTSAAAIKNVLERRRRETKSAQLAAVVLAAPPALSNDQIQQLQQELRPLPLLIYTDTRDEFVHQVAVQQAVWNAQARGPKQPRCGL